MRTRSRSWVKRDCRIETASGPYEWELSRETRNVTAFEVADG